jgi:hypothetical protein
METNGQPVLRQEVAHLTIKMFNNGEITVDSNLDQLGVMAALGQAGMMFSQTFRQQQKSAVQAAPAGIAIPNLRG